MSPKKWIVCVITLIALAFGLPSQAWVKGIYLRQNTLENTGKLRYLINESKAVGINTFVIDVKRKSKAFDRNIQLVKEAGLNFVARIVVFPDGGSPDEVRDPSFWQRRMGVINYAIGHGAKTIQLDYIRYNTRMRPSPRNAEDIAEIIKWFKQQVHRKGVELQVDVFGETSYKPSLRIGQNVKVFAPYLDSLSPMLYPSHWEPYVHHSRHPYDTVFNALRALDEQFNNDPPFSIVAFIETSNYRYRVQGQERLDYIYAQLKAVQDADVEGWYAWSANNYYQSLFRVLRHYDSLR